MNLNKTVLSSTSIQIDKSTVSPEMKTGIKNYLNQKWRKSEHNYHISDMDDVQMLLSVIDALDNFKKMVIQTENSTFRIIPSKLRENIYFIEKITISQTTVVSFDELCDNVERNTGICDLEAF